MSIFTCTQHASRIQLNHVSHSTFSLHPSTHPPLISSFSLALSLSLPVLQCDVTTRELMFRILGVLHSSFPTHTQHKWKASLTHPPPNTSTASLIPPVHLCLTAIRSYSIQGWCLKASWLFLNPVNVTESQQVYLLTMSRNWRWISLKFKSRNTSVSFVWSLVHVYSWKICINYMYQTYFIKNLSLLHPRSDSQRISFSNRLVYTSNTKW